MTTLFVIQTCNEYIIKRNKHMQTHVQTLECCIVLGINLNKQYIDPNIVTCYLFIFDFHFHLILFLHIKSRKIFHSVNLSCTDAKMHSNR